MAIVEYRLVIVVFPLVLDSSHRGLEQMEGIHILLRIRLLEEKEVVHRIELPTVDVDSVIEAPQRGQTLLVLPHGDEDRNP